MADSQSSRRDQGLVSSLTQGDNVVNRPQRSAGVSDGGHADIYHGRRKQHPGYTNWSTFYASLFQRHSKLRSHKCHVRHRDHHPLLLLYQ